MFCRKSIIRYMIGIGMVTVMVTGCASEHGATKSEPDAVVKEQWSTTQIHLQGWGSITEGTTPSHLHNKATEAVVSAVEISLGSMSIPVTQIPMVNASNVLTASSPDRFRHTALFRIEDASLGCDADTVSDLAQGDDRCTVEIHNGGVAQGVSDQPGAPDDSVWLIGKDKQLNVSVTTPENAVMFTLRLRDQLADNLPDWMTIID